MIDGSKIRLKWLPGLVRTDWCRRHRTGGTSGLSCTVSQRPFGFHLEAPGSFFSSVMNLASSLQERAFYCALSSTIYILAQKK